MGPKENYFSLMTNWNEMVNTERHPKEITCISGIRIISIMAVVIGHFLTQGFQSFKNTDELFLQLREGDWKYFHGSTLCVDSFFSYRRVTSILYIGIRT